MNLVELNQLFCSFQPQFRFETPAAPTCRKFIFLFIMQKVPLFIVISEFSKLLGCSERFEQYACSLDIFDLNDNFQPLFFEWSWIIYTILRMFMTFRSSFLPGPQFRPNQWNSGETLVKLVLAISMPNNRRRKEFLNCWLHVRKAKIWNCRIVQKMRLEFQKCQRKEKV